MVTSVIIHPKDSTPGHAKKVPMTSYTG